MGNYFTSMDENYKKNQELLTETNTIKLERQIQLTKQLRDRWIALEIAKARELFYWYGSLYMLSFVGLVALYSRKRKWITILPLVPLTFITAYQADLAYGNKTHRILLEAEHIMQHEKELLALPLGLPTVASIDLGRMRKDEEKRLHPMCSQK